MKRLKDYSGSIGVGANIGKNKITPNSKAVDDYLICFNKLRRYVDYFFKSHIGLDKFIYEFKQLNKYKISIKKLISF